MKLKSYAIWSFVLAAAVCLFVYSENTYADEDKDVILKLLEKDSSWVSPSQAANGPTQVNSAVEHARDKYGRDLRQELEDSSYETSYNADGYLKQVSFHDGIKFNFNYVKNSGGDVVGVVMQATMSGWEGILITRSAEDWLAADLVRGVYELTGIKFEDYALVDRDDLNDLKGWGKSARVIVKSSLDKQTFGKLLGSLKQPTESKTQSSQAAINFSALRSTLEKFKLSQDKAFHNYKVQTQAYYDILAAALKENLSTSAKTNMSGNKLSKKPVDDADRKQIDQTVAAYQSHAAQQASPGEVRRKIAELQPMLAEMYIAPNREKLRKAVETNIGLLQKNIFEMLILQGSVASVGRNVNTVEIMIALPQSD